MIWAEEAITKGRKGRIGLDFFLKGEGGVYPESEITVGLQNRLFFRRCLALKNAFSYAS